MTTPASYSTPTLFAARIGPRLFAQLTAEEGNAPNDEIAAAKLREASNEIDIRLGTRYVVPITHTLWRARLAGIEEQIALWFAWVYRGIGDQESGAAAAKVGYDAAMAWLKAVMDGEVDLVGVDPRPEPAAADSGWSSNEVVYRPENFRRF